jgi:hypothetical protein
MLATMLPQAPMRASGDSPLVEIQNRSGKTLHLRIARIKPIH